ncbi:MAG: molybdopterin-dependent oxidoreductase [Gordonibacter sp.]
MNTRQKGIVSLIAGGTLALSSVSLAAAVPPTAPDAATDKAATGQETAAAAATAQASQHAAIRNIQGTFAWNQEVRTDNATLEKQLYRSSTHLCAAQGPEGAAASPQAVEVESGPITHIEVSGDVSHAFTASVSEFTDKAPAKKVMGCTCAGNPADGLASANAAVEGFRLAALINEANPAADANTITFTARDGYRVALPLSYVTQRYSIIVSAVNGEGADSAIGCSNQLWLGSTSARTFVRDVVAVEITCEATPPPVPGAPSDANQPNIGVTAGSAER